MCKPGTTASTARNVTTQGSHKIISVAHYTKTSDVLSRFPNQLAGNYPSIASIQSASTANSDQGNWLDPGFAFKLVFNMPVSLVHKLSKVKPWFPTMMSESVHLANI